MLHGMDRAKILQTAQAELQRHTWGTFVDEGLTPVIDSIWMQA